MGTRLDVIMPGIEDEFADQVIGDIKNELDNLEGQISNYIDESLFNQINKQALKVPVATDDVFIQLFSELRELCEKTLGYFDFTTIVQDHSMVCF